MRSTDTTFSPSSTRNTVTPWAARPWIEMPRHRDADGLAGVGDQHQVVAFLHREGGDHGAVLLAHADGDNAGAAAAGDAIFIG